MSATAKTIEHEPQKTQVVAPRTADAPAVAEQPTSDTAAIIQMIERAARDVSMPIDRLEKLLELRERVEIKAALRPIYTKHGFGLSFNTEPGAATDYVRVTCRVSRGGYSRIYQIDMPADGKGAKGGDVMTKTHATGSAMSYGSRYLLKMIFNISVGDDDDGNAASNVGASITADQLKTLEAKFAQVGGVSPATLAYFEVASLAELPAKDYERVLTAVDKKIKDLA